MPKINIDNLIANHAHVAGYLLALAEEMARFVQGPVPEGVPPEVERQAKAEMAKVSELFAQASQAMGHPGVITLLMATASRMASQEDEPEARLTTRKVAQA